MGAIKSPFQGLVFNTSQREPVRLLLYLDSSRSFKFAKDWMRISSGIEIHWLHWDRCWNFTKIRAERLLKIFNDLWQESQGSSKFCIYPSFSQTAIGSSCNFPQGDEIVQYSFTIKPCTEHSHVIKRSTLGTYLLDPGCCIQRSSQFQRLLATVIYQ